LYTDFQVFPVFPLRNPDEMNYIVKHT
jgi:hypothetical protein